MFSEIKSVHFVGIGGTAMAAVAAAMRDKGFAVTGSDHNVYPPMSTFLAAKQIEVMPGYAESNLARKPDLVVIGNAISRGNPEAEAVLDHKLRYCSLPELLKEFFIRGKRSLVVAGTHGKTTTTSLLAWVFEHNGLNPGFLIGGIPNNFGEGARFTDSPWFIIEGDEYDTAFFDKRSKFVHYLPEVAVINNLEFDHADIFENLAAIQTSFRRLIDLIPRNGQLLANGDDPEPGAVARRHPLPGQTLRLGRDGSVHAFNLRYGPTATEFEIPSFKFHLNLVGRIQRAQRPGGHRLRQALRIVQQTNPIRLRHLQGRQAPHGSARHRRRRHGGGRFRPSSRRPSARPCAPCGCATRTSASGPSSSRAATPPAAMFSRRNWPTSFADADAVIIAEIARLELLKPEERLDPDKLIQDLKAARENRRVSAPCRCHSRPSQEGSRGGDVICVFSNGGFGNIHEKLLAALGR